MSGQDKIALLPCPFCGAPHAHGKDGPEIREHNRNDRLVLNKAGRRLKGVNIAHSVECVGCGAQGPQSITSMAWHYETELTDEMIEQSQSAAALAWNARQPIHDRAYDLVNRLIVDAFAKIDSHE